MEQVMTKNIELEKIEKEIITLKNQTAENMIQIGCKLIEAKKQLSHGEWGVWLENKVEFSQRTANQFMRIAKEFGSNSQAISNLEITKVGLLLDVPAEKREEFIEKHDLKSMSTREMKKVIKESVGEAYDKSVIDNVTDYNLYEIPIDELKPLPDYERYFGNRTGKDYIFYLNCVDKYGITESVMIARDKTIIDGHERVRAWKDLGHKTITCRYASMEEKYRKGYSDDKLKLYLFLIDNMRSRSSDWYIAEFWLDELFGTNYGDKSGDITHYLTDERIEALNHNQMILQKMHEVIVQEKEGIIDNDESSDLIKQLREQYVEVP